MQSDGLDYFSRALEQDPNMIGVGHSAAGLLAQQPEADVGT